MSTRDGVSLGLCWSPTLLLFVLIVPLWIAAQTPPPEENYDIPSNFELVCYLAIALFWVLAMLASLPGVFIAQTSKTRLWAAGGVVSNYLSFLWYPALLAAMGELRSSVQ